MLMTFFKHYGLIFNTYISLLVGVNVANVLPNTSKIPENVDVVMRFQKLCTSCYLTHWSKSLNVWRNTKTMQLLPIKRRWLKLGLCWRTGTGKVTVAVLVSLKTSRSQIIYFQIDKQFNIPRLKLTYTISQCNGQYM